MFFCASFSDIQALKHESFPKSILSCHHRYSIGESGKSIAKSKEKSGKDNIHTLHSHNSSTHICQSWEMGQRPRQTKTGRGRRRPSETPNFRGKQAAQRRKRENLPSGTPPPAELRRRLFSRSENEELTRIGLKSARSRTEAFQLTPDGCRARRRGKLAGTNLHFGGRFVSGHRYGGRKVSAGCGRSMLDMVGEGYCPAVDRR